MALISDVQAQGGWPGTLGKSLRAGNQPPWLDPRGRMRR